MFYDTLRYRPSDTRYEYIDEISPPNVFPTIVTYNKIVPYATMSAHHFIVNALLPVITLS
jgi:hypothetical protein